jgi:hypothetical protein
LPGTMDGRVPVTFPGDTMLLHGGHERLHSSTMRLPTDAGDLIVDSDASVQFRGRGTVYFRDFTEDS